MLCLLWEVCEACWILGHGLYTTRCNAVPVAIVALLSIFRLHRSFIDNCNHGQTISNLFAWHINVAILPSLTYLSTCALSGAIFRSHTSLPLFASLKLWSFNTSPWRAIITAAKKESGFMVAARVITSQKQLLYSKPRSPTPRPHQTNLDCRRQKFGPVYTPNIMQAKSTIFRCLKRLCKSDIVIVQTFVFL